MKWHKNRGFLITGLLLAGIGFGTFMAVKEQGGLDFTLFRLERWGRLTFHLEKPATPAEIQHAKQQAKAATDRAFHRFPDLRVEERNIPHEKNGYLRAYKLAKSEEIAELRASGVSKNLSNQAGDFDAVAVRAELENYEEVDHAIIEIAELSERSSVPLPGGSIFEFPAGELKAMSDYLLLKSRVAATEGDGKSALKYISLAVNLNNHLRDIEHPSLLSETVVILVDLGIRSTVFIHLIPTLGGQLDLDAWRSVLKPPDYTPSRLAFVLKGEWFAFSREMSQTVFIPGETETLPDPEYFCMVYAGQFSEIIMRLQSIDSKEMAESCSFFSPTVPEDLSSEGKLFVEMVSGVMDWRKGFSRASVLVAQYDAAFDLLIRERNGMDLSGLKETFVVNPVTELPFDYDPLTRELSDSGLPSGCEIDPLVLPKF